MSSTKFKISLLEKHGPGVCFGLLINLSLKNAKLYCFYMESTNFWEKMFPIFFPRINVVLRRRITIQKKFISWGFWMKSTSPSPSLKVICCDKGLFAGLEFFPNILPQTLNSPCKYLSSILENLINRSSHHSRLLYI